MKKSELFKYAQMAVVNDSALGANTKLAIIRELQHQEYISTIIEEKENEEGENEDVRS